MEPEVNIQPSADEKKKFALHIHAAYAFYTVANICEQILEQPIEESDSLYNPLITAIYISYGRPFSQCYGFGKLNKSIVPQKFIALHDDIIKYRNEMYAHADEKLENADYGPSNKIRFCFKENSRLTIDTVPVQHAHKGLQDILKLSLLLKSKMEEQNNDFVKKYLENIIADSGYYFLDTKSEDNLFIERDDEEARAEDMKILDVAAMHGIEVKKI